MQEQMFYNNTIATSVISCNKGDIWRMRNTGRR
nr:MAG TPA: hypothetical protein [Bacteriophage sp.]